MTEVEEPATVEETTEADMAAVEEANELETGSLEDPRDMDEAAALLIEVEEGSVEIAEFDKVLIELSAILETATVLTLEPSPCEDDNEMTDEMPKLVEIEAVAALEVVAVLSALLLPTVTTLVDAVLILLKTGTETDEPAALDDVCTTEETEISVTLTLKLALALVLNIIAEE